MPRVARTRVFGASPARVWDVVSDPHHLPRWWPRTVRVETVTGTPGARRSQWTQVLETERGKGVRADYRCVSAASAERCVWEQSVEGTPFERILKEAEIEIRLRPSDGGTAVTLESRQRLRGFSRLGSPMMRRATGRTLSEALDNLDEAIGHDG